MAEVIEPWVWLSWSFSYIYLFMTFLDVFDH